MRACSSASGGVMFLPDNLEEEKSKTVSYKDIVKEEAKINGVAKSFLFGRKKPDTDSETKVA